MASKTARVLVIDSVEQKHGDWTLCFSFAYMTTVMGKRIMAIVLSGKKPDGKLQAARGRARIPDMGSIMDLIGQQKNGLGIQRGHQDHLT